jgi:hypothetical protein
LKGLLPQNVVDQVRRKRLADELGIARQAARTGYHRAGGDHDTEMRPALRDNTGKAEPVHVSAHLHIGDQELEREGLSKNA